MCGQHYFISRLQYGPGKWADLRNLNAMFFPLDADAALVTVFRHDKILGGAVPLRDAFRVAQNEIKISAIEYVVSACAGGKMVTEDFMHPFERGGAVLVSMNEYWMMESEDGGRLFTTRYLDDMLSVNYFGAIKGAQFCC